MSIKNYTDAELNEAMDAAADCYGDTFAQYRSEVAQFGDAWAGADADLERARAGIAELDREHERRFGGACEIPNLPEYIEIDNDYADDDIPF
jgi:hypothetical protein